MDNRDGVGAAVTSVTILDDALRRREVKRPMANEVAVVRGWTGGNVGSE